MKNGFSMPQRATLLGAVLLLPTLAACSGKSSDAEAATNGAGSSSGANRGGGGGEGGGPRGASTIMLSGGDVATVKRGAIEAAVPVTGDLRPLETIDVRARIEGELEAVFVREGQRVGAGQLLARFESVTQQSDRASAEADLASARAAASTAEWNAKQSDDLFKAGAISERDARAARNDADAARARVAAAEARLAATSTTARDTRVLAPNSGIVATRSAEPGEHVTRGTSLFTVVRADVLELTAAMPARLAGDVSPGQVVHFVADGRRFDGTVARVSPTVDPTSRTVTVYVQVANPNGTLKGNTFASGRVVARTTNSALVVPNVAVRTSPDAPDKPFVYKLAGDKLARTPVSLGIVDESAGTSEVLAGLDEGDKVVAGNVGTLGNGMKVQILEADRRNGGSNNGGRAQRTPS
jgi:membrane fusion protein (multidrug efflux system)